MQEVNVVLTKVCKRCNFNKDISNFHKDKKLSYGVGNICKNCCTLKAKEEWSITPLEHKIFNRARSRAKRKKLEFNITIEDIIIPENCPIFKTPIKIPSIDRIDSSKGYIKGNIQIVSNRANMLKNNATIEELQMIVKYLETSACEVN